MYNELTINESESSQLVKYLREFLPHDSGSDKPAEECGVFGILSRHLEVSRLTYFGLYSLQHRGQESAGISVADEDKILNDKGMGLVNEVFTESRLLNLQGSAAIGHVRYSTAGDSSVINAQPLRVTCRLGEISLAHNGNLTNGTEFRQELEKQGTIFQTSSDSEILAHLIAKSNKSSLEEATKEVAPKMTGAYSFLLLAPGKLIGLRDPYGFRPLSLGKINNDYVLASETCAFDTVGAQYVRDVEPGEMVVITDEGAFSEQIMDKESNSLCIFEYIYFARPDSNLNQRNVHLVRKELGKEVSREADLRADIVSGVPDSSLSAASGVSEALKIPYETGLIRNRYVGRTFIQPTQELRDVSVKLKLNPVEQIVRGQRIILVDDSIVRGTTLSKLIDMLRNAGASEIHVLISSPPVKYPCNYGIDTSSEQELIAAHQSISQIKEQIGASSLHFLSVEGMLRAVTRVAGTENSFCTACFSGAYPEACSGNDLSTETEEGCR